MSTQSREPDFDRLRCALLREGEPDLLPFMELKYDHEIMEAILGRSIPRAGYSSQEGRAQVDIEALREYSRALVEFYYLMGHDYVRGRLGLHLPLKDLHAEDTAELAASQRNWRNEARGPITSWDDFARYPWPAFSDIDFRPLEYAAEEMVEGMRVIGMLGGIFEYTTWLMGYETFCYALYDQPDLVKAVSDRVGKLWVAAVEAMAGMDAVGAVCSGDDMGFKTGTLTAPEVLREYILPWHKKCVEAAHGYDKPYVLHSCGDVSAIMDELIDEVGIDAKHSYEDVIMPIAEVKKRWGERVAIVGGVDVDVLARRDEQYVRDYTRNIILNCAPGGGYVLGSGNSITNYCRVENVLAMYDEGRKLGVYPIAA